MAEIEGSVAVVTGGQRGLGSAFVRGLLDRGASKVYATARSPQPSQDPRVVAVALDVTDPESVSALAGRAQDASIVLNNAGVWHPGTLLSGSFTNVRDTFETNVFGPLAVARAFAPVLAANGGGALVNIHSVLSWAAGAGAYGASKAALWSLTNSLRMELASQHTQVVGVHLGFADTDMTVDWQVDKLDPADVADSVLDGIQHGDSEVLADRISHQFKSALAGPARGLEVSL
jgi:NAD(P)-dependent dehydrogenase (short-subunit alcohol dehydrogenase family)